MGLGSAPDILLYVAPATVAGYSATYGIALMTVPSPIWRTKVAVVGAIDVSITALIRFTGIAVAGPARQ